MLRSIFRSDSGSQHPSGVGISQDFSYICSSEKRLLLLNFIKGKMRYSEMKEIADPSQLYRHFMILFRFGLMDKDIHKNYFLTEKGKEFIKRVNKIIDKIGEK
jgi:predicted transcriptional regulator